MRVPKLRAWFPSLCFIFFSLSGCSSTDTHLSRLDLEGTFNTTSLENPVVHKLKLKNNVLYSGTDSGLFQSDIESNSWNSLGVPSAQVRAFAVLEHQEILAALNFDDGDSLTIGRTTTSGKDWIPYRNNYGGDKSRSIPTSFGQSSENNTILYAAGSLFSIAKSTDKGKSWKLILGNWDGFNSVFFLKVNSYNPNYIYTGGTAATFQALLYQSSNSGDSWQNLSVFDGEANVYDVVVYPNQSNIILAGLTGSIKSANIIRKSTDGGQSWQTVLEDIGVRTFTHSARNPEIVYASGLNDKGTLFFAASNDFGDTWQRVEWADSPTGVRVNDMVSVMEDGHEVLYLGTNMGLYSYTFEE